MSTRMFFSKLLDRMITYKVNWNMRIISFKGGLTLAISSRVKFHRLLYISENRVRGYTLRTLYKIKSQFFTLIYVIY